MKNWKDYVGYQPTKVLDENGKGTIFHMTYRTAEQDGFKNISFNIDKEKVLHELTDAQVGDEVEKLLSSFTDTFEVGEYTGKKKYSYSFFKKDYSYITIFGKLIAIPWWIPRFQKINLEWRYAEIQKNRIKNKIAHKSRRGAGNTIWKNVIFYKGSSPYDAPIYVSEYEGKYAVFTNPNFQSYGIILK